MVGRRPSRTARTARTLAPGQALADALPLPPLQLRELVGTTDPVMFDQPSGVPVFAEATAEQYASILDFGCGCGRIARRLALADAPTPERYLGIDLHRGMIRWDNENLAPWLPSFSFVHHDAFNRSFNPTGAHAPVPLPAAEADVTLIVAWSVFTHLVQAQAEHYLDEVARVLAADGVMICTWFLFDKSFFPMMQDFQAALYINEVDPTNAVIFDRDWLLASLDARGLRVRTARAPEIRGYHWLLEIEPGTGSVDLGEDESAFGRLPPPLGSPDPSRLGLDPGASPAD